MSDQTGQPRNEDEHNAANRRYADKFSNRIRDSKAAPRLPAPGDHDKASSAIVRKPRIELSLTQILGSTGAAVTAAFLGSRLGVAGTLIGAALASVISVVGGAIYTSSIKATRRRVSEVMVAVRSQDDDIHGENEGAKHDSAGQPQLVPAVPLLPVGPRAVDASPADRSGAAAPLWRKWPDWRKRPTLGAAVIGGLLTAAVFAGALVVVTGYETVSGTAISGGQSGGLTILGGGRVSPGTPTRIPTTTPATTPTSGSTTVPATTGASTTAATSPATISSTGSTTAPTTGTSTTSPTTATTAPVIPPSTAATSGTGTSTPASTAATSGSAAGAAQPNVPTSKTP